MEYGERDGGFQRRSFAPVKVGDELDTKIEAVGEKGDGIAKKDGFVLFVPGVKAGDNVRIRVTRILTLSPAFTPGTNNTKPSFLAMPSPFSPTASIFVSSSSPTLTGAKLLL